MLLVWPLDSSAVSTAKELQVATHVRAFAALLIVLPTQEEDLMVFPSSSNAFTSRVSVLHTKYGLDKPLYSISEKKMEQKWKLTK